MKIVYYQSVQADHQNLPQEFQSLISDPYGVSNLLYCLLFKGPIDKKRQRKSQDQRLDLGINRQVARKTRHEAIWRPRHTHLYGEEANR